jgi:hypothetical protein
MALPRLRPLDAYRVRINGRDLVCVRDLEGILEEPILLRPRTFLVASLLDGTTDVVDVQVEYARRTGGEILLSWDLQRLIEELDRQGLLESESLARRRQAVAEAFAASAVRAAYHAGKSYPDDPHALTSELERYLRDVPAQELNDLHLRGTVAPHIDFARGGWCYAWAHAALAAAVPETVVVLGVAHAAPDAPLIMTTKPFETPLGTLPVDPELAGALQRRAPGLLDHEIAHRTEHSIECQVVFLQHVLRGRPAHLVPLLCSGLERWTGGESPHGLEPAEGVIDVIREALAGGRRLAVLASVDFSHVGPRFGDQEPADQALAARTSAGDRPVLEAIVRGDAEAFWEAVMRDGNPRRLDAASAVYLALRILEPCRGRLLRYGQATDPAAGVVSFASVALL